MTPSNLKIFTGTWNCAECNPEVDTLKLQYDMLKFMQINKEEGYDIYAIGLQEIEMNASSMVKEETGAKTRWRNFFKTLFTTVGEYSTGRKTQQAQQNNQTAKNGISLQDFFNDAPSSNTSSESQNQSKPVKYREVTCLQLVGILLIVYCKDEHSMAMRNEDTKMCREGALGVMGNKGSAACRFKLYDRDFVFINMHLSAHMKNVEQRNQNLNNILSKTIFKSSITGRQCGVMDHDFIFIFGDMNYRIQPITPDFNDIVQKIQDDNLTYLSSFDQCQTEIRKGHILKGFQEGEIFFPPTFKFKIGTDEYNPKRIPSWCDRVFYRATNALLPIEQLAYGSSPSLLSDHKPVFAVFDVPLKLPFEEISATSSLTSTSLRQKVRITPHKMSGSTMSSNMFSEMQPSSGSSSLWSPLQPKKASTTVSTSQDSTLLTFDSSVSQGTNGSSQSTPASLFDDDPFDMNDMQQSLPTPSITPTSGGGSAPPPPPKKSSHQWYNSSGTL